MNYRNWVLPLALVCSPITMAATDGDLGATSEASTDVSIEITPVVRVSVEQDIVLTYTAGDNSTGGTGLCIYRNADEDVDVTVQSDDASAFELISGASSLNYSVDLTGGSTNLSDLTSGLANTLSDENNTSSNCAGGYSHDLAVTVLAADLDAAPAGTYSDTIEILVAPN